MDLHTELVHPTSTKTNQNFQFYCAHCPFKARFKCALKLHDLCHRNQTAKYKCSFCSYSVNCHGRLNCHVKLHSRDVNEENNNNIGDHHQVFKLLLIHLKMKKK